MYERRFLNVLETLIRISFQSEFCIYSLFGFSYFHSFLQPLKHEFVCFISKSDITNRREAAAKLIEILFVVSYSILNDCIPSDMLERKHS